MARPGLLQHKKFRRVERAVDGVAKLRGFGKAVALGCLEMMWSVAYEAGDEVLGTPEDVEAAAGWTGPVGLFFSALRDAGSPEGGSGFVEPVPDLENVWRIHDLWHHAPEYVAKRAAREVEREERGETLSSLRSKAGKKGADKRWQLDGKRPPLAMTVDGKRMANGLPPAPAPAPAPQEEAIAPKAALDPASPPATAVEAEPGNGLAVVAPLLRRPETDPEPVFQTWTEVCVPAGFSIPRRTDAQKKAARTRLKERGWFETFQIACGFLARTPFYQGQNDRAWVADLSWVLERGRAERLAEKAEHRCTSPPANGKRVIAAVSDFTSDEF